MSEYEDEETDNTDDSATIGSFAFLSKVKSNTPRARFDIHFYADSIQLIQYNVQKEVSNRYRIYKEDVREMLRLPYSNDKQIFFVLHLKRPIVGGNKCTTKYDFVVFNFASDDFVEINLDLKTDPIVNEMFSEDIDDLGYISGKTFEIVETLLVKIFARDVITSAKNYTGGTTAPGLQCTFWDSDDHFLYPLDDGFVNVWKYCQKLKFKDVKSVRFVRSQGRFKTFDFYIYPKMDRSIRRYNIGSSKSQYINCFFLEFKAIDQKQYSGLLEYCEKNQITISTEDFRESASGSSNSDGDDNSSASQTETTTNLSSGSDDYEDDNYEVPDPHLVRCQTEGQENESGTSSEESDISDASQEQLDYSPNNQPSNSRKTSKNSSRARRRNTLPSTSSSDDDGAAGVRNPDAESPRKRSLRISSDDESVHENEHNFARKRNSTIIDSDEDGEDRSSNHLMVTVSPPKRSRRIGSDDDSQQNNENKFVRKRNITINDSDETD